MEKALSVKEVADILNVNQRTIYRLINDKKIPAFRVADSWRFLPSDLENWINQQKTALFNEEDKL